MAKTYRRFSSEFKLPLVEAYLAGAGSMKGIATGAGIEHSLLHYWIGKYRAGELSLDIVREETLIESEQQIAALERKVGQLTMELDLLKRGLIAVPAMNSARSSIISGPAAAAPAEDVP
jgi:transposase